MKFYLKLINYNFCKTKIEKYFTCIISYFTIRYKMSRFEELKIGENADNYINNIMTGGFNLPFYRLFLHIYLKEDEDEILKILPDIEMHRRIAKIAGRIYNPKVWCRPIKVTIYYEEDLIINIVPILKEIYTEYLRLYNFGINKDFDLLLNLVYKNIKNII